MDNEEALDELITEACKIFAKNMTEEKVSIEHEFSKRHQKQMKKIFKKHRKMIRDKQKYEVYQ